MEDFNFTSLTVETEKSTVIDELKFLSCSARGNKWATTTVIPNFRRKYEKGSITIRDNSKEFKHDQKQEQFYLIDRGHSATMSD